MKVRIFWLLVLAVGSTCYASAQINPLVDPDSPAASALQSPESSILAPDSRSWKRIIPDIAADQKRMWSFPLHIFEHNNWVPVDRIHQFIEALA